MVSIHYDSSQLSSREEIQTLDRHEHGQRGRVEERRNPLPRCKVGRHCILLLISHLA